MEPVSALSLACNVIQVVEQAIGAAKVCKELYERGSLDDNNAIERYADGIAAANKELEAMLQQQRTAASSPRPTRLAAIAADTSLTATELKTILNQLKLSKKQGNRHLGGAFKATLKSFYKRGAIDTLQRKLAQQETALQSGLLKDLYLKAGDSDLVRRKEFQILSQGQKDIVTRVLDSQQLLSRDIVRAIEASNTKLSAQLEAQDALLERRLGMVSIDIPCAINHSEANIINHLDAQDKVLEKGMQTAQEEDLRARLLDALAFPQMKERLNMIQRRAGDMGETCSWILDPFNRRHQFLDWLEASNGVYWVSGKPGSGKSTLMDFIYKTLQQDGEGREYLEWWAGPTPIRLLSFWFFRPASTELLKSMQGFWRSLCFQILDSDDDLVKQIRDNTDGAAPSTLRSPLVDSGSRAKSWTDNELKSWFEYLLRHSAKAYFLVIDGLDEMESDRRLLSDVVLSLAHDHINVKICCSSRPESPFLQALVGIPSLRLQDFNFRDIRDACHRKLANTRCLKHADEIAYRAEGVFLWAAIVSEDLRTAMENGDDEEDIEQRLAECPSEINDLFRIMLQRQDKFYQTHPKPYLRLIDFCDRLASNEKIPCPPVTLFELLVASLDPSELFPQFPHGLDTAFRISLNARAVNLESNVVACCSGLVEIVEDLGPWRTGSSLPDDYPYNQLAKADKLLPRFIHRSAQDFLRENSEATRWVQRSKISDGEATMRLIAASVLGTILGLWTCYQPDFRARPLAFARLVAEAKAWTKTATTLIDTFFAANQAQQTKLMAVPAHECRVYDPMLGRRWIVSAELSPVSNITFLNAARHDLTDYIQTKLQELDSDKSVAAAAIALCGYPRPFRLDEGHEFLNMLEPYLAWSREVSLYYGTHAYGINDEFLCSCSLLHHSCLAQLRIVERSSLRPTVHTMPSPNFPKEIISSLGASSQKGTITAWTIMVSPPTIIPEPLPCEIPGALKSLESTAVFRILVNLEGCERINEGYVIPIQWSPQRVDRFLDLPEAIPTKNLPRGSNIHPCTQCALDPSPSGQTLAAVLNSYLEALLPEKIAEILWHPRNYSTIAFLVFDSGKVHHVDKLRRGEWEGRMWRLAKEQSQCLDPVMSEICKLIKSEESEWERIRAQTEACFNFEYELPFFLGPMRAMWESR